jgi:hypothetical protein
MLRIQKVIVDAANVKTIADAANAKAIADAKAVPDAATAATPVPSGLIPLLPPPPSPGRSKTTE